MAKNPEPTILAPQKVASFSVTFPKTIVDIAKMVIDKKEGELRPSMLLIAINMEQDIVYATDTRKLIADKLVTPIPEEYRNIQGFFIDPAYAKEIAGKTVGVEIYDTIAELKLSEDDISRQIEQRTVDLKVDGQTLRTTSNFYRALDVTRVIPRTHDKRIRLELTPENRADLMKICKIHKDKGNYQRFIFKVRRGSDWLQITYVENDGNYVDTTLPLYTLKLKEPVTQDVVFSASSKFLLDILPACTGAITLHEDGPASRPIFFESDAMSTILMPMTCNDERFKRFDERIPKETLTEAFQEVYNQLNQDAQGLWNEIQALYKGDMPVLGTFTAKQIKFQDPKAKCGFIGCPECGEDEMSIAYGGIQLKYQRKDVFSIMARWESAVKGAAKFIAEPKPII